MLEIGQHLAKLWRKIQWHLFSGQCSTKLLSVWRFVS